MAYIILYISAFLTLGLAGCVFFLRKKQKRASAAINAAYSVIDRMCQDQWIYLSELNQALSGVQELKPALSGITEFAVPEFADYCAVDLLCGDNKTYRAHESARTADGRMVKASGSEQDCWASQIEKNRLPKLLRASDEVYSFTTDRSPSPLIRDMEFPAFVSVLLCGNNRTLGRIIFARQSNRADFKSRDLALAKQVADRAGAHLENIILCEELKRAVAARNDFMAILSHDLKSPLNTVLLSSQLIMRNATSNHPDPAYINELGDRIKGNVNQMAKLMDHLLDLHRLESDHFPIHLESSSMETIFSQLQNTFEIAAEEKKIRLTFRNEVPGTYFQLDPERIFQALMNVVGNAIKFTPAGGAVVVSAACQDGLLLSVEDSGPGIPEADRSRIFDRYWQGHDRDKGSAGLGLAIAKGIVEAHHGRIWVESAPKSGSKIFLLLPAAIPKRHTIPSPSSSPQPEMSGFQWQPSGIGQTQTL